MFMPVLVIQIQKMTIQSSTGRGHVPEKIHKIFKELPNVFGIADDFIVVGYKADSKGHDQRKQRVLHICRQVNLKLNKEKCHFRCSSVLFFVEVISWHGIKQDPQKLKALMEMSLPK